VQQNTLQKECTVYGYNPPSGFEYMFKAPSTEDYLKQNGYEELPGAYGLLRFFRTSESRLAHKYAVLLEHEEYHLFILREYQFTEFLQKFAPIAPVLPEHLPFFQGQVMTKKLF
jgi:hypothetical protein